VNLKNVELKPLYATKNPYMWNLTMFLELNVKPNFGIIFA
jgi:hypothetical protein